MFHIYDTYLILLKAKQEIDIPHTVKNQTRNYHSNYYWLFLQKVKLQFIYKFIVYAYGLNFYLVLIREKQEIKPTVYVQIYSVYILLWMSVYNLKPSCANKNINQVYSYRSSSLYLSKVAVLEILQTIEGWKNA